MQSIESITEYAQDALTSLRSPLPEIAGSVNITAQNGDRIVVAFSRDETHIHLSVQVNE